jgi:hypothetical protein
MSSCSISIHPKFYDNQIEDNLGGTFGMHKNCNWSNFSKKGNFHKNTKQLFARSYKRTDRYDTHNMRIFDIISL